MVATAVFEDLHDPTTPAIVFVGDVQLNPLRQPVRGRIRRPVGKVPILVPGRDACGAGMARTSSAPAAGRHAVFR